MSRLKQFFCVIVRCYRYFWTIGQSGCMEKPAELAGRIPQKWIQRKFLLASQPIIQTCLLGRNLWRNLGRGSELSVELNLSFFWAKSSGSSVMSRSDWLPTHRSTNSKTDQPTEKSTAPLKVAVRGSATILCGHRPADRNKFLFSLFGAIPDSLWLPATQADSYFFPRSKKQRSSRSCLHRLGTSDSLNK